MKLGNGPPTCGSVMGMTLMKTKHCIGGGALTFACLVALNLVSAQTNRIWNSSISSDWSNATNWTPVGVPASNDTINFSKGTINFTGPVTINGQFNWSGGTLSGNPLTIASNGVMNVSGSGSKMLANVLTNAGTVNWVPSGGTFYVQNNNANVRGAIYNLAGALWDLQTDQNISCYYCGAAELFNNAGTLRKSGGTGTTTFLVGFYNSGVVSVLAGTLSLGGGGTVEGTFNLIWSHRLQVDGSQGKFLVSEIEELITCV